MMKTGSVSVKQETVRIPVGSDGQQGFQPSPTAPPPTASSLSENNDKMALWDKAINHTLSVSLKAPPSSGSISNSPALVEDPLEKGVQNEKMAIWKKAINDTLSVSLKATP